MSVAELLSKLQAPSEILGGTVPSSDPKLLSLIEALRKDHLMQVLTEPSLMTMCDRPACCRVGGELNYQVKDSDGKEVTKVLEYGTRLDVLPHLISSERIHVDFRLRKANLYERAFLAG